MPLTPENIAKINEFIEDHGTMRRQELTDKWGAGKTEASRFRSVSGGLTFLRHSLGIPVKAKKRGPSFDAGELAEFRAWKAQQKRIAAE